MHSRLVIDLTKNLQKFRQIDGKLRACKTISVNFHVIFSYLVASIAILLRDRRLGGYVFANPWEPFHPKGRSPLE